LANPDLTNPDLANPEPAKGSRAMDRKEPPFQPVTGNPEAHDYLDWYRHLLQKGRIKSPPADQNGTEPPRAPSEES
jgi:hypothetical protein